MTRHRALIGTVPRGGSGAMPPIALDDPILGAIRRDAWFVFSLSGGKDSAAAAFAANRLLDQLGHPRTRRVAIHADLGRAEWESTPAMVEAIALQLGLPLIVVRRRAGDLVQRWEQRFANARTRCLIGPWSQANKRFCTSELKAQVIGPELARRFAGGEIISVIGIRREESAARRAAPISEVDLRFAKPGNRHGTCMRIWHPVVDWMAAEIFACHAAHGLPLHEAYACYGSTRLSCRFCVLASRHDLAASASASANAEHYRHLVEMEARSTFSFQPARWLGDIAPQLLSAALQADFTRAKADAAARKQFEASLPPELRFLRGWPPRRPTRIEAVQIAAVRRPILDRHGLEDRFATAHQVLARFDALLAARDARRAR